MTTLRCGFGIDGDPRRLGTIEDTALGPQARGGGLVY
jgi:hypothetical protein